MGFLTDAINLGGPAYIAERGIQNVQDQSQQARQTAQAGATQMQNQTQFKPFAVTSGVGSAGLNAQGNINMNLNAQAQDLQNQLQQSGLGMLGQQQSLADTFGQTSGALGLGDVGAERGELLRSLKGELGAAGLDPTNRSREQDLIGTLQGGGQGQQDIFNQLEALQASGREQDRLGLEERLFAQGRGGVRTAQFGGTPEQLAMAQAQEQARLGNAAQSYQLAQQSQNQASQQALAGIQQAGAETGMFADIGFQGGNAALQNLQAGSGAQQAAAQTALQTQAQLANLGQSQIQGSFDPQRMLLEQMDAANQTGSLVSAGQRTGAQLGASMLQAGMGTQADLSKLEGDLRQQQMKGLVDLLTSGQANSPNGAGLLEQILGKIL
tara:strand:+ start:188 stop:1333 length:1146 start_codon:yes stop_codon:yes gene_type:complete